jgi:5-methylthioribose kinase
VVKTMNSRLNCSSEIEIDRPEQLIRYLRERGLIASSEQPRVRLLTGGVSSRTVLVEREEGQGFVVKQALAKLRVASDWSCSTERIYREALGMRCLGDLLPAGAVTELLFEDTIHPIIVMSAVAQPNCTWKEVLLSSAPDVREFEQFAAILAQLHAESHDDATLATTFADTQYFESLRLRPYYEYSAQQVPEAREFLLWLAGETLGHKLCLVHGDYSPKNILVHEGRFVLLDHEVIHYGDPAFDLGFSLTHLLAKTLHREEWSGPLLKATQHFITCYLKLVEPAAFPGTIEVRACRHTVACLLARVAGRSPLEYLTQAERRRVKAAALRLMKQKPGTLLELTAQFVEEADA